MDGRAAAAVTHAAATAIAGRNIAVKSASLIPTTDDDKFHSGDGGNERCTGSGVHVG